MAHSYSELKEKTVAQLREIAKGIEHEAVKGYTQLNKEHLLAAICQALGIDTFEHHHAEVKGKTGIKARIRKLKEERDKLLAVKDQKALKSIRKQIKSLKKQLRKAMI
jgi:16S rRNA C967 or C1407 C5-methylase (RsmB/RsmF family)